MPKQHFKSIRVIAVISTIEEGGMASEMTIEMPAKFHQISPALRDRLLEQALPELAITAEDANEGDLW